MKGLATFVGAQFTQDSRLPVTSGNILKDGSCLLELHKDNYSGSVSANGLKHYIWISKSTQSGPRLYQEDRSLNSSAKPFSV
ncbi:Hypothetical predicted protein [Pelobates cultripes]|uniref:Uncharacterized protein n=1 Tax=Pelobates cultripes TaxID=61616 RepID=A0AAD1SM85_PELCU|nr:Hypothetical predicted protein [Pelobates cultripes]